MAEHCICTERTLLRACPVHGVAREDEETPLDLSIDDTERLHRLRVMLAHRSRQALAGELDLGGLVVAISALLAAADHAPDA